MANIKSAKKKIRKDKKRTQRNKLYLTKIKNFFRRIKKEKNSKEGKELIDKSYSIIDKAAKENIIHKNKAKRLKSQVAKLKSQK